MMNDPEIEILLEKVRSWGGVPEEGLAMVLLDKPLYARLLLSFCDQLRQSDVDRLLLAGNTQGAYHLIHELKGSAATLALTPMLPVLNALLDDLREADAVPESSIGRLQDYHCVRDAFLKLFPAAAQNHDS